jgi:muramoyltetrapeptide carboxypeptidase
MTRRLVGIVAPSFTLGSDLLDAGIRTIEAWGYKCRIYGSPEKNWGRLAGDDRTRANALLAAFSDPDTDVVLATCGGYGVTRILPLLTAISAHGKTLIGYSDVTPLLIMTELRGGHAIHGPMVDDIARGLTRPAVDALIALIEGDDNSYNRILADTAGKVTGMHSVEGSMIGGNLSLVVSLLGTAYAPDYTDRLLVLEDWNEPHYRIDRMLSQLAQSGAFQNAAGIILGEFTNIVGLGTDVPESLAGRVAELAKLYGKPIFAGFPSGHRCHNIAWPLGRRMRLGPDAPKLVQA